MNFEGVGSKTFANYLALSWQLFFFSLICVSEKNFRLGLLWFLVNSMVIVAMVRSAYADSEVTRLICWYLYFLSIVSDFISLLAFGKKDYKTVVAAILLVGKPLLLYFLWKHMSVEGISLKRGMKWEEAMNVPLRKSNDDYGAPSTEPRSVTRAEKRRILDPDYDPSVGFLPRSNTKPIKPSRSPAIRAVPPPRTTAVPSRTLAPVRAAATGTGMGLPPPAATSTGLPQMEVFEDDLEAAAPVITVSDSDLLFGIEPVAIAVADTQPMRESRNSLEVVGRESARSETPVHQMGDALFGEPEHDDDDSL